MMMHRDQVYLIFDLNKPSDILDTNLDLHELVSNRTWIIRYLHSKSVQSSLLSQVVVIQQRERENERGRQD